MRVKIYGWQASLMLILFFLVISVILFFLFGVILIVVPIIIGVGGVAWLLNKFKKKKKGYMDVEFKVR